MDEKWIKLDCTQSENTIQIRVTDSGLRPANLNNREAFKSTKSSDTNAGLGLSIVSQIIEKHNGKFSLDLDSENTSFLIELPISELS